MGGPARTSHASRPPPLLCGVELSTVYSGTPLVLERLSRRARPVVVTGAYLDDITEEQLLSLTHLPTAQAAQVLKMGYV